MVIDGQKDTAEAPLHEGLRRSSRCCIRGMHWRGRCEVGGQCGGASVSVTVQSRWHWKLQSCSQPSCWILALELGTWPHRAGLFPSAHVTDSLKYFKYANYGYRSFMLTGMGKVSLKRCIYCGNGRFILRPVTSMVSSKQQTYSIHSGFRIVARDGVSFTHTPHSSPTPYPRCASSKPDKQPDLPPYLHPNPKKMSAHQRGGSNIESYMTTNK